MDDDGQDRRRLAGARAIGMLEALLWLELLPKMQEPVARDIVAEWNAGFASTAAAVEAAQREATP